MSQAKVDRYKEQKKNRAKIMAKEKREKMLLKLCGSICAIAIVGWAGYSVYETATKTTTDTTQTAVTENYTIDSSALTAYLTDLKVD